MAAATASAATAATATAASSAGVAGAVFSFIDRHGGVFNTESSRMNAAVRCFPSPGCTDNKIIDHQTRDESQKYRTDHLHGLGNTASLQKRSDLAKYLERTFLILSFCRIGVDIVRDADRIRICNGLPDRTF